MKWKQPKVKKLNFRLENNIKQLYKVFESYTGDPKMEGSPAYDDLEKWNHDLYKKPLTKLSEDDLSRFVGKTMTTWGGVDDFKHFLPRIFELTAQFKNPYEIWITFEKLSYAEWSTWPVREQEVVHEFMIALWENILEDDSEEASFFFKDYFSAIAHFTPNFEDLLDIWRGSETEASIVHLCEYIVSEQTSLFEQKQIVGFYDKTENVDAFIAWILSDETMNKLQEKHIEFEGTRLADNISCAEHVLTKMLK